MRSTQRFPRNQPVIETDCLRLDELGPGVHRLKIELAQDGACNPIQVPVQVFRGHQEGPVVGITAAVHGNEVNGIPAIHRLLRRLDVAELKGTVVAAAPVNVPGFLANVREFRDGKDLNRLFPGKPDGNESQVFANAIVDRIVRRFDYLLDLHTASFGRINSLYIRADMSRPVTAELSRAVRPQIILHNPSHGDGTLRGAAEELGIHALTVEIGDPSRTQAELVRCSSTGLRDVLEHLGMVAPDEESPPGEAVECVKSSWLYTDSGGMLEVFPEVVQRVKKGEVVAQLLNEWGEVTRVFEAPADGIVIGRSTNPVAHSGARILHYGIEGKVEVVDPL
ncbi:MAG: succinylglutamate desuccinylase/aspartoacylase family protein [Planctomycetota bacterium]